MDNEWLNNLRNKMEDHTEDVPEGLWDDISDELFHKNDENKIVGIGLGEELKAQETLSNNNLKTKIYRAVGVAAAIAVCFFVSKELFNVNIPHQKEDTPKVAHKDKSDIKKTESFSDNQQESKGNESIARKQTVGFDNCLNNSVLNENSQVNILGQKLREENKNKNIYQNFQEEIKTNNSFDESLNIVVKEDEKQKANLKSESFKIEDNKDLFADNQKVLAPESKEETKQKKVKSTKWMLSMLTGNTSSGSAEQFPGYATAAGKPMGVSEVYQSSSSDMTPFADVLLANQNQQVEARIRHKTPVNFGLSLYYSLGKKWGIGTGINYTKLASETHSGSDNNYIKTDQSIHYIGIPVQVNYNVVKKGRFTGYVTAGALAEKAVSGKQKTRYVVDNEVKEEFSEKVGKKPLQVSVNSAVGVQFKIINNLGVYAEPGVAYHFKDDSELNTIYKEKPFNFNMKFGIRLQID